MSSRLFIFVLKAHTSSFKIEISISILFSIIFLYRNLIVLIGDLRKYCDSNGRHLPILDIRNIHTADRFPFESQFLRGTISALEWPRITQSGIFTASTRSQYRGLVTRDWTRSHLLKTGTRRACGGDACFCWRISDDATCRPRMRVSRRSSSGIREVPV